MIRLWSEVVPRWLEITVTRAITRNVGKSGCDEWEAWAEKWLSGEDRSARAAYNAAYAAGAAARAAARATNAARAAAYAAAYVAYAAYAAGAAADAADATRAADAAIYAAYASPEHQTERQQQLDDFVAVWKEMRKAA
jgi:hypothetical protein